MFSWYLLLRREFNINPDEPLGVYLCKVLFDQYFALFFAPGQLKLLQESKCEEGGSEEEYTSLFNKKTSLGRVEYYLVLCVISG